MASHSPAAHSILFLIPSTACALTHTVHTCYILMQQVYVFAKWNIYFVPAQTQDVEHSAQTIA